MLVITIGVKVKYVGAGALSVERPTQEFCISVDGNASWKPIGTRDMSCEDQLQSKSFWEELPCS